MKHRATRLPTFTLVAILCLSFPFLISSATGPRALAETTSAAAQTGRRRASRRAVKAPARMIFSHRQKEHQLACDKCHTFPSKNWKDVRKGDAAFPDVTQQPEHASCLGCHQKQFFARERPQPRICSVCHVAVTPRNQARLAFPNPPENFNPTPQSKDFVSDFRIGFPHDKHLELVGSLLPEPVSSGVRFINASFRRPFGGAQDSDPKSCAVCHQTYQPQGKSDDEYATKPPKDIGDRFWLKKGTFKTIPNHAACFSCHSQDSGILPAPNDCNMCHKLTTPAPAPADFDPKLAATMGVTDGTILSRWRRRESSGAFRHEGGVHPDQSCTACHNAAAMNTLDAKTMRVPVEACNICHITATTDDGGALNFEIDQRKTNPSFQCVKCHVTYGREPIPDSHTKAVAAAKTD